MAESKDSSKASSNSNVLKAVAGVAIGVGVALGAYFFGKTEGQEEARQSYQHRVSYAQNITPKATTTDKFDDDEKLYKECEICKASLKQLICSDVEVHSTICGHIFCKPCIDKSLELYERCPSCNERLSPGQTHRIFL